MKLSVVVATTLPHFCRARCGLKSSILCWNFDAICHSSRNVSISGFHGHFRFSVITIISAVKLHGAAWHAQVASFVTCSNRCTAMLPC